MARRFAALPEEQLLSQCEIRRGRRSGPGGQHRNKVETAIFITHGPTGVRAEATERRSQQQNRRTAVFRLRVNLALSERARVEEECPSELWRSRIVAQQVLISPTHEDFPAILAEALDVIMAHNADVKSAAELLGCTTSQLVKLLKLDPRALQSVNEHRSRLDLSKLQ